MPAISPAPGQVSQLYWQQEDEKRRQAAQNADAASAITPAASLIPDNSKQNLQTIDYMGKSANLGVQGSVVTQNQRAADAQQKAFQAQQQKSISDLQAQAKEYSNQYSLYANSAYGQQAAQRNQPNQRPQLAGNAYTGQDTQIAQYARQAGFPESQIPMAIAIAHAESGGRADAVNNSNSNGSSDHGLMQINSIHSGLLSKYDWKDPQQNMDMAYQIFKDAGSNWTPWSTYNNGAYDQFLSQGQKAASAVQPVQMQPFQARTSNGLRNAIVKDAKQYFGVPYEWGGTDLSKGVDCSGLVQGVYSQMGIKLPRTAHEQAVMGIKTSIGNLQPGDLVAWNGNQKGDQYVGHIAIYAGGGQIIEAQQNGVPVHQRTLGSHENVFGVHLNQLD